MWTTDEQGSTWSEWSVPGFTSAPHSIFVLDVNTVILVSADEIAITLDGDENFGVLCTGERDLPGRLYAATYRDGTLYVAGNNGTRVFEVGGF